MIAILRITGQAGLKTEIEETLRRLNIHRKLACTLIDEKDNVSLGMLNKVQNDVAYSKINDELIKKLIEKRGQTLDGKQIKDSSKALDEIKKGNWKIKKFFRLHPPRGGFKKSTKLAYPKGILGENKNLDKLIERML